MDVVTNEIMYWCYNYPFNNNVYSYNILTLGAAVRSEDDAISGHIYKIFDGSPLANVGFESGDRLVKAYVGGFSCLVYSGPRRVFFKEGADLDDKRWGLLWIYCIPYAPLYTKQRADYLTSMPAGFGRVHYKLEGKYGMKHLKISQSDFPDKKGTSFTSQYISKNTVNCFLRY